MQNRTEVILNQFADSWIETEHYFENLINNHSSFESLKPILQFILSLRAKGQDSYFRLGTSIHRLIISRSVDHGLRRDQKYIIVEAYDKKLEVTLRGGDRTYRQFMVENLVDERVTKLIKTLKDTLID
ncbi:hypothetical protein FO440_20610 [Mucilaginibacter corticis]|uniref:Uncharacterized protein n=1 Tax=Mucilaginibacter corticis TaxID=2597670 RepID=A0A556MG43_9SPHI|nr:hypothetical protein [Mucilaginibacter corticis]TSJ38904.1 hypothetical protein FO440_20610 [Mucilaginibacter corticis]